MQVRPYPLSVDVCDCKHHSGSDLQRPLNPFAKRPRKYCILLIQFLRTCSKPSLPFPAILGLNNGYLPPCKEILQPLVAQDHSSWLMHIQPRAKLTNQHRPTPTSLTAAASCNFVAYRLNPPRSPNSQLILSAPTKIMESPNPGRPGPPNQVRAPQTCNYPNLHATLSKQNKDAKDMGMRWKRELNLVLHRFCSAAEPA